MSTAASVYNFSSLTPSELGEISRQLCFNMEKYFSEQSVGTLSGGERLKLQLSRLLFDRPTILLLDEPSSDLDISTLQWLEGFLNSYKGIILYISHDEMLLENTANVILHLEHPREGKTTPLHGHSALDTANMRSEGNLPFKIKLGRPEKRGKSTTKKWTDFAGYSRV